MTALAPMVADLASGALRYAAAGWPVLPLRAGAKVPAIEHGLHDATTDADTIRAWWPPGSCLNVGAVVPLGRVVVDVDGRDALARLHALDLDLPATARQRTPRGWHYVYAVPDLELRQTASEIAPGVDTRTAGRGYIVVEPSIVDGRRYGWDASLEECNIAEAPDWLLERLSIKRSRRDWSMLAGAIVERGSRNETLASVAGLVFRRLPARLAYDLARLWAEHRCDPPLPDREIERTLESVAGRELLRRERAS